MGRSAPSCPAFALTQHGVGDFNVVSDKGPFRLVQDPYCRHGRSVHIMVSPAFRGPPGEIVMQRTLVWLLSSAMLLTIAAQVIPAADAPIRVDPQDWPWWRGPARNGVAADQRVPVEWSETKNVLWKTPVPGRGHASPI